MLQMGVTEARPVVWWQLELEQRRSVYSERALPNRLSHYCQAATLSLMKRLRRSICSSHKQLLTTAGVVFSFGATHRSLLLTLTDVIVYQHHDW